MSSNLRAKVNVEGKAFLQLKRIKSKTNANTYADVVRRALDIYEKYLEDKIL